MNFKMRYLPVLLVMANLAAGGVAQGCAVPSPQQTFSNRTEFVGSFWYNLGQYFFDLDVQRPIAIDGFRTWNFDAGQGNPVVPTQVGNQGVIRVYRCATSRIGNETTSPTAPGSPWTLLGTGTLTVVDARFGESPIVFNPPLQLAAGQHGIAIEFVPTTTGQNPGPLHCLGVNPNPNTPVADAFVTFRNDGIQQGWPVGTPFTGSVTDSVNLRMLYTPDPQSAYATSISEGCYFRPFAFYENFASSVTAPDVANTAQRWSRVGNRYQVAAGSGTFAPPTTPSLTLAAPYSSSSPGWDDALSAPIQLPFSFPFPGGSTNEITISSNASVYLANVVSGQYAICGASYGSSAPFRDSPARIAAYFQDLDGGAPSAGIHYEVDPAGQFVRITWQNVPEWPPGPGPTNNVQVTLFVNGDVDLVFGSLSNASPGNNAILGFTPGTGSFLSPPIDFATRMPFQTGDGAVAPILSMDARPVLGSTVTLITDSITPGTLLQVLAIGLQVLPAPVDLTSIGMPGCLLTLDPIVMLTGTLDPLTNRFAQGFAVPGSPSLQNAQVAFQAAPLTTGLNPLGIVLSNGLCARLGL